MTAAIKRHAGKTLTGTVVSTKMKDTVVVEVDRFVAHPKYRKYLRHTKRFKAHDAGNKKKVGEKITIVECAPISKGKHFRVLMNEQSE
ncbi:MAG: 30S ribosomal protein S17 [Candidatus Taylorbacteria bacterium RIFCSPHIGHO2_01_FULL_51_15]|uniref:Small ribosomal subunit protein uS17 n=1 Tax=Candidatus Taylorbacteria bacterium RIFCSPHIGHO2_01_FULL_51_15 TaxID=1802304 RepID=A0A1G2MC82_9BACT|nr:MAG: 30S ribosomal protein S17 [Candidatus Taylorbacteria bacterium RIFCSPHIGHO2_01_FULL_51_15]